MLISAEELQFGGYYRREEVERDHPEIMDEWNAWLNANTDPGNYDAYKVRDQNVLPYIDGKPQWVCDTFMPPHLVQKIYAAEQPTTT